MGSINSLTSALGVVPSDIVNAIAKEYTELESRFSRHDWTPGELNSGRFAEAILRYLEWKESGGSKFTSFGTQVNRQAIVNRVSVNTNVPEGLRFLALKCTELLLDIRNKRDVAHPVNIVNVDEMDSRLALRLANWVLSEIIRVEATLSTKDIQEIIDELSVKEISLIDEIDGDIVFIGLHLKMIERVLVVLYHTFPKSIDISKLRQIVKYGNSTRFRDEIVNGLVKDGKAYLKNDNVFITSKGIAWLEKYVDFQMKV